MSFANAFVPNPALALLVGIGHWVFVGVFSTIGGLFDERYHHIGYAFPTAAKRLLTSASSSDLAGGAGLTLAYTIVLFGLGLAIFRWRDV